MLIPALLLAAATASPAPAPAAQEADIVVIARRLGQWNGKYAVKPNKVTCKTVASTGDKAIDAIGCQAFITCVAELRAHINATDARGVAADERTRMKNAVKAELGACVMKERQLLIQALADRRAAAR